MFLKKALDRTKIGNFRKYIKYALGEIILLVCGILLALQINTWNDNRKANNELDAVFQRISTDLELDIAKANNLVEIYTEEKESLDTLLSEKMATLIYERKSEAGHHCNYAELIINHVGFDQLVAIKNNTNLKPDTLIIEISDFYQQALSFNTSMVELVKNTTREGLEYYRDTYEWYPQFLANQITDEIIRDIYYDTRSRNFIEHYRVITLRNYLPFLEGYKETAEELKAEVDKRIAHEN